MASDDEEKFREIAGENWGKMEAAYGTEGYASMIELNHSQVRHNDAHTKMLEEQTESGRRMMESQMEAGKTVSAAAAKEMQAKGLMWAGVGAFLHLAGFSVAAYTARKVLKG